MPYYKEEQMPYGTRMMRSDPPPPPPINPFIIWLKANWIYIVIVLVLIALGGVWWFNSGSTGRSMEHEPMQTYYSAASQVNPF